MKASIAFLFTVTVFLALSHSSEAMSLEKQERKEEAKAAKEKRIEEKQENKEEKKAIIEVIDFNVWAST